MAVNYGLTFTNQTAVQIPAATHGLGHRFLRVQVYDDQIPRHRIRPGLLLVDPSTFAVTAQFLQPQSGLVVLNGASPPVGPLGNRAFPFTVSANGSTTIAAAQHGFSTDHLLVDVYSDATPRVWLPYTPVTVHPTTFAVTASFVQPQSGVIVISAAADVGTPNQGHPLTLTAGTPVTILGTTHGFGTANLGLQCYDALGQDVVPGAITVDPTSATLTVSSLQNLTGTLVLNGSVPAVVTTGPRMVIASGGALLLGGASQGQRSTGLELTTGYYTFTFLDEAGAGVPAAVVEALYLTMYDTTTGAIINSRMHQNVLNTNQGVLEETPGPPLVTTFTLELLPTDAAILDQTHASESRTLLFQWTWAGGQRAGAHVVTFTVNNLTYVP